MHPSIQMYRRSRSVTKKQLDINLASLEFLDEDDSDHDGDLDNVENGGSRPNNHSSKKSNHNPGLLNFWESGQSTSHTSRTGGDLATAAAHKNGFVPKMRWSNVTQHTAQSTLTAFKEMNDNDNIHHDDYEHGDKDDPDNQQGKPHKHGYSRKELMNAWMHSHWPIALVSILIFVVLAGAGISLYLVVAGAEENDMRESVLDLAKETGAFFANELDVAILPLFSMAQFATELDVFANLPEQIKAPGEEGALPFLPPPDGSDKIYRNITGVCDQPDVVNRFTEIASAVKRNARMDGILHNIQLAPQGVICLLHPMNNTDDFTDGSSFLDNTGAWGIDLLHDPFHRYIARQSIQHEDLSIVGPRTLVQCPTCGMYFIIRLPVLSRTHVIDIDGDKFLRWGFATALINWDALIKRSRIHERFQASGYEFQLTRTDYNYNEGTDSYDEEVVVLATSEVFGTKTHQVSTALQTTNNEWVITIMYSQQSDAEYIVVVFVTFALAFFVAVLVYTVLVQKQAQASMMGIAMAESAKVDLERKLTGSLAHELRNPLSAIDSALATMPDNLPEEAKELVASMQLCSSFMSSIMNNLLDSRKLEEGKMELKSNPMSLKQLVNDVHKMMLPAVNANVKLRVDVASLPPEKEWVYGDPSRIQQVITNLVSNACKYTRQGSITMAVSWVRVGETSMMDGEEWVQLLCRDTGPGIPKEEQDNLFNRFTTRGGAPGSGLGLAIARQIVDLYGGSIRFESDPTVKPGTDCIVLLPLKICKDAPQQQQTPEPATKKKGDTKNTTLLQEPLRILLTDDIKMNRAMLKRRFQKCLAPNCSVTETATGEEALKMCESQQFDIVVMDQYMQEASGVLLGTDTIIAMRRAEMDAVIIGCSGNDLDSKFLSAGADLIWKKPIPSNDEILASLRPLLAERGRI